MASGRKSTSVKGGFFSFSFDYGNPLNIYNYFVFYRISDCTDHVVSIFTGSHVFMIQALSAMLLAKLASSDPRLLVDQVEQVLDVISTALTRLPQVRKLF